MITAPWITTGSVGLAARHQAVLAGPAVDAVERGVVDPRQERR